MRALQSIYAWVGIVILILLALPTVAVVRLFDRSEGLYTTGRVFRILGDWITRVNPRWNVAISGRLPDNPRRPFVVVSNHQSSADIPAISRLPWEMKWVAKKALFDVPVVGWMMRMAGDIPVDRKDPDSRANVVRRAKQALAKRVSVMFMPEGTRSRDGRVLRYQDGAFRLAVELGVPVLPLAIDGTAEALPKHGWRFGRADVRVHVFDPVETTGLGPGDITELRETVRQRTIAKLAEWRGVPVSEMDAAPAQRAALGAPEASGLAPLDVPAEEPAARGEERAKTTASGG